MKKISRREFLKNTGVAAGAAVGGGLLLSGCASLGKGQTSPFGDKPDPTKLPEKWDLEADVVIVGAGAVGLPAAIRARDAGASVLVVDCNYDIGGHAIISGGNVPLGGGTSWQKRDGIVDDPEILYRDLTDWSVTTAQGMPIYRYNERAIHRVMADNMAPCFEFLLENGVRFAEIPIDNSGANGTGISALREAHTRWTEGASLESPSGAGGTMLCRDLEATAKRKGVKFILNYHMDVIFRESLSSGRVLGIQASYTPTILPEATVPLQPFLTEGNIVMDAPNITIKANKSIIIGTGGSSSNPNLRRIVDPRLTEEIPGAASEFSPQDGSGELAICAIGGAMWGIMNQGMERGAQLLASNTVGVRHNYPNCRWDTRTPIFPKLKAVGFIMRDWQNAIMVNQVGKRFYSELAGFAAPSASSYGYYDNYGGYVQHDWRNSGKMPFRPNNYIAAALAENEGSQPPDYSAGPQWAILDSDGVARQRWEIDNPDYGHPEYFFKADTLEELAEKISANPYQKHRMDGQTLKTTVDRYNTFVAVGRDEDFDKPTPQYRIEKPPFYAAWNTVMLHDTYMGVRISGTCQVLTLEGDVIPGLYAGGECSGGANAHGLARCLTQGYVAGYEAAVTG
ncbi:MAG: FAD-binding protein [Spirochaetales bacterium]|jgi:ribulose 1,5-bisphosphate synthetase/thiazole synthase|nr:FAD-binding protein [Spirochaetales bacterium]